VDREHLQVLASSPETALDVFTHGGGSILIDGAASSGSFGNLYVGGDETAAAGAGELTVGGGAAANADSALKVWPTGAVSVVDGGFAVADVVDLSAGAALVVDGASRIRVNFLAGQVGALSLGGTLDLGHAGGSGAGSHCVQAGQGLTVGKNLNVGYDADASLSISQGGKVANYLGYVGCQADGNGVVVVEGDDSAWENDSWLTVGCYGRGGMTVRDGGEVSSVAGSLAWQPGSHGTVLLEGPGASWTNSQDLCVGEHGTASMVIRDAAESSNSKAYVGRYADANGSVTVRGSGAAWTNGSHLYVAYEGLGTMTIEDGGLCTNVKGCIAYGPDANGSVTVRGSGAVWAGSSQLYVAREGCGSLTVEEGGNVTSAGGYVAGHMTGGENAVGIVTVDGNASKWTSTQPLHVGYSGRGSLTIRGGGAVEGTMGYVGRYAGACGAVLVDGNGPGGAGSAWSSSSDLYVGYSGEGTVTIANGGEVSSTTGCLGKLDGGEGAAIVDGPGSIWRSSASLYVGDCGRAELTVRRGGCVSSSAGGIGYSSGSDAAATVEDSGSRWFLDDVLYVGFRGSGSLVVRNGGEVRNATCCVAHTSGSVSGATVGGAGADGNEATWRCTESLYVGGSDTQRGGRGEVTVEAGGRLLVDEKVTVWPSSRLNLTGGLIAVEELKLYNGAMLDFTGGRLAAGTFDGELLNSGGQVEVLSSPGVLNVTGGYAQAAAGSLRIGLEGPGDLAPPDGPYDQLAIDGNAALGGTLRLQWRPVAGDPNSTFGGVYEVLTYWGDWLGESEFAAVEANFSLDYIEDVEYHVDVYGDDSLHAVWVTLHDLLDGDADLDGEVGRDDFHALQVGFGSPEADWFTGDFNLDGSVNFLDYLTWKANVGDAVPGAVPEPATLLLFAAAGAFALKRRLRARRASGGRGATS